MVFPLWLLFLRQILVAVTLRGKKSFIHVKYKHWNVSVTKFSLYFDDDDHTDNTSPSKKHLVFLLVMEGIY